MVNPASRLAAAPPKVRVRVRARVRVTD